MPRTPPTVNCRLTVDTWLNPEDDPLKVRLNLSLFAAKCNGCDGKLTACLPEDDVFPEFEGDEMFAHMCEYCMRLSPVCDGSCTSVKYAEFCRGGYKTSCDMCERELTGHSIAARCGGLCTSSVFCRECAERK
tara:strand:- start:47 stop:445 length:399 start_codon:yes stop_codon:yes gene_type:complete